MFIDLSCSFTSMNRDEGPIIFLTSIKGCSLQHLAVNGSYHDHSEEGNSRQKNIKGCIVIKFLTSILCFNLWVHLKTILSDFGFRFGHVPNFVSLWVGLTGLSVLYCCIVLPSCLLRHIESSLLLASMHCRQMFFCRCCVPLLNNRALLLLRKCLNPICLFVLIVFRCDALILSQINLISTACSISFVISHQPGCRSRFKKTRFIGFKKPKKTQEFRFSGFGFFFLKIEIVSSITY